MKTLFRCLALLSLMVLCPVAQAQLAASNVRPVQREDTKLVDIDYDVTGTSAPLSVALQISSDGGSSWTVPATSLTGAIGNTVTPGSNRRITWDAGADWNQQLSSQMKFRLSVTEIIAPAITSQPLATAINSGAPAILAVTASGSESTFQWYVGSSGITSNPVSGATSALFISPPLTANTSYWVRASNRAGTADSNAATVTVTPGFALIPAGSFAMGDVADINLDGDAAAHTVTVSAFYMAKNPVTLADWNTVWIWALSNGYSDLTAGFGGAANHPVERVSWFDAIRYCNARSQKEGLTPVYYTDYAQTTVYKTNISVGGVQTVPTVKWSANGYRLPTEAEWEKAARGGLSGKRFPWGDTISHSWANYIANSSYSYDLSGAVNRSHPAYSDTSPVGSFAANGYGLHDMAGNVWQWCWDWYGIYDTASPTDPRGGASSGSFLVGRVARGGNCRSYAVDCRVANRYYSSPTSDNYYFGFRVARSSVVP